MLRFRSSTRNRVWGPRVEPSPVEPAPDEQPSPSPPPEEGYAEEQPPVPAPPLAPEPEEELAEAPPQPEAALPTAPPFPPSQPLPPPAQAPVAPPAAIEERVMRVAFDVRFWEMSGLGTFSRELLRAFTRLEAPIAWTLIGPESLREQMPAGMEIERWLHYDAPVYAPGATLRYPRPRGAEILHYPHYNLPLAGMRHAVVSVFDLFHLKYGTFAKRFYQRMFLRRLAWSRALLVTSADKVTRELVTLGRLAPGRIRMVPLGPGRGYEPPELEPEAAAPVVSLAGTQLRGPWLLATGIDQPHKNFDFLLPALSLYYQRRPDAPSLVWVGISPEDAKRRMRQLPAHARMRIACESFSGGARLEALMSQSVALVFPSLDEGFGLPPLEAMRRGVPVLCAQREPMVSICGNAPLYFEPTESASLWRMLDRLIDNPRVREEVRQRGLRQVARYSWERTAFAYWKIYREAAGWPAPPAVGDQTPPLVDEPER